MLLSMPELTGHSLRVVDIADDPQLVDTLGEHIPVLMVEGTNQTHVQARVRVDWPFDSGDVMGAIRQLE